MDTEYDPYTGITDLNRQSIETRASALDPNRHVVDPGSFRQIDRWIRVDGRLVREHGTAWTSYGVPHSNITRDSTTHLPGGAPGGPGGDLRVNDRQIVVQSVGGPGAAGASGGPGGPVRINDRRTTVRSGTGPAPQPAPRPPVRVNDRETVVKF